ncbi:uncharacterized protein C6orf203 isoform X2 [Zootermopsis nevadensis]|uniref:uncharacterized protein C6orf203 isoform X2 n=1 Tax=Zootermopsis nevadensis TaxID=136037 RepID=UPI000B8EA85D|nr:uncharacterized protein C6orf203 isoform X2 [Zootermopsis nevadensis]
MNSLFCRILRKNYIRILHSKSLNADTFLKCAPKALAWYSLCKVYRPNLEYVRNKYTGNKQTEEYSDSEDEEDFDDEIPDRNAKVVTVKVNSLRTDLIIKSGLSIARNKVEVLFYESRIRVNGRKIFKKSVQLHVGDEVDVIRGLSPMNPEFLVVSRLQLLSIKAGEENISVKLRRFKSLIVENYGEPWKEAAGGD